MLKTVYPLKLCFAGGIKTYAEHHELNSSPTIKSVLQTDLFLMGITAPSGKKMFLEADLLEYFGPDYKFAGNKDDTVETKTSDHGIAAVHYRLIKNYQTGTSI